VKYNRHIEKVSIPERNKRRRFAFVTFDSEENMERFMRIGVIAKDNR
jgi:RNA recognition motif. (a.k.a. RRM, RBD, or RNP domain)